MDATLQQILSALFQQSEEMKRLIAERDGLTAERDQAVAEQDRLQRRLYEYEHTDELGMHPGVRPA